MKITPILNVQTKEAKKHTEITEDIKILCSNLLRFAEDCRTPPLAGLAANQLAKDGERIMERICLIRNNECRSWFVAINPSIIKKSKEKTKGNKEGCLTWPKKTILADRYNSVTVSFTDLDNKPKIIEAEGFEAFVWQHEINHLDGVSERVFNPKTGRLSGLSKENEIATIRLRDKKIGLNKPCLCGSGKKYKKCCGR